MSTEKSTEKKSPGQNQEGQAEGKAPEVPVRVSLPREEYEQTLARLQELESLREQLLRSAADFENAKKRLTRERDEFVKFSQEALIRDLLPVLDNFERALAHVPDLQEPVLKNLVSGIQLVFKQLSEVLKPQGLKRLQSVGQKFDPHKHEAIGYVEKEGPEDRVVEEIEPGYLLHDRLLRAAKVKVSAPSSQKSLTPSEDEKQDEIT